MSLTCRTCRETKEADKFTCIRYANGEGKCKACVSKRARAYYVKHRVRISKESAVWYAANREKHKAYVRAYVVARRKKTRNFNVEDPEEMMKNVREVIRVKLAAGKHEARRGGYEPCHSASTDLVGGFTTKCQACGRECGLRIHLDHDHKTGAFRGWLFYLCNTILGYIDSNSKVLGQVLRYRKRVSRRKPPKIQGP